MLEAILSTMHIMGWLGVVLGILVLVNTVCGTMHNLNCGEGYSWSKMLKGLAKALVYYLSSATTAIAFTILPFINNMITNEFGVMLLSADTLNMLSSVAVLAVVVTTVVVQGKKAINGIIELANMTISKDEVITWDVIDPLLDRPNGNEEE